MGEVLGESRSDSFVHTVSIVVITFKLDTEQEIRRAKEKRLDP